MDLDTLKTILNSQDQAYRTALELFMKQIGEDLRFYKNNMDDLKRSLEFTQAEVHDLKLDVKRLEGERKEARDEVAHLRGQVVKSEDGAKKLEDRLDYQEDYNRRNNLHITGIEEQEGETWEQTAVKVKKLLESKLQLQNTDLERAHRVGLRRAHGPRPVVARFSRFSDREAVIRNVTKLRGTKIYINEDLCPASQAIKREKLPLLKQARSEGKIAYFSHTKLIIKDRTTRDGVSEAEVPANGLAVEGAGASGGGVEGGFSAAPPILEPDSPDDNAQPRQAKGQKNIRSSTRNKK